MTKIETNNYDILIKENIFNDAHNYLTKYQNSNECFIITDKNVFNLYKDKINEVFKDFDINIVVIKPGEKSKDLKTYNYVINQLLNKNIKRHHTLIALGGGVVGDLTGFIASTLYRGISYIHIPTTLLAQVDSSIGAKTGLDLKLGKNLIGSFYEPKVVLIDPLFLNTLPKRHFNNGMAEVIKAGLIYDVDLFNILKTDFNINEVIKKAIMVKKHFVIIDPFDLGERKKLNFGHTIGHALESSLNYKKLYHGEAISIGMIYALNLGVKLGLTNNNIVHETHYLLDKFDLIKKIPKYNISKFNKALNLDKKSNKTGIDFIIVTDVGNSIIKNITKEVIDSDV